MQLSEIAEHNRQFTLDIAEHELATLMRLAADETSFPPGSGAAETCKAFVRECEGWQIEPKNHGL